MTSDSVVLRTHKFEESLKMVMWVSTCVFSRKAPTRLIQVALLERRDEDFVPLFEGQVTTNDHSTWECNQTQYFLESDRDLADKAFSKRVALYEEGRGNDGRQKMAEGEVVIGDLPPSEEAIVELCDRLFQLRGLLSSFPEGSVGRWISHLAYQNPGYPLHVQSPSNCCISHELEDLRQVDYTSEKGLTYPTVCFRLKGRTE